MIARTITFRCSQAQLSRMDEAIRQTDSNRASLINESLEDFLTFAESPDSRSLDLFELVAAVDAQGEGPLFSELA